MNDRYLFKAKRIDWRELPEKEWWVVGYYLFYDNTHIIIVSDKSHIEYIEIDPTTICQCSGLKDKKRTLIWENDICDRREKVPEIVNYNEGDWQLDYSYVYGKEKGYACCNLGFYVTERKCVEVIGNIFDNPELLEVEWWLKV